MAVLQRKELEDSPLADLHAIASELGLEGFRTLRKDDLVSAILEGQGGEEVAGGRGQVAEEEPAAGSGQLAENDEAAEVEDPATSDERRETDPATSDERRATEPEEAPEPEAPPEPEEAPEAEETAAGVLDVLPNGSGFVRVDPAGQSRGDVYVSPAQIRRCELRAGDELAGPVRPPRRNERHPSLVRVETVNGSDAEPPEERPHFTELTPVFPTERLSSPPALESVPFGRGSRVSIGGPPGAGATTLLRELAQVLTEKHSDLQLAVALAGVRPEEVGEWRVAVDVPVYGGSFERSHEAQAQAAELAVERAKRAVERGGHAVLLVDSLEGLPAGAARRVFGAGRKTEEGGSLTVVATTGMAWEPQRWATTRILLDAPGEDGRPGVSAARSGSLRSELLG